MGGVGESKWGEWCKHSRILKRNKKENVKENLQIVVYLQLLNTFISNIEKMFQESRTVP